MKVCVGMWQIKSNNCLNRLLHEVLGFAPAIPSTIFFCKVNIFPLLEDLPHYYSIFYNRITVSAVHWYESDNVSDVNCQPNYVTCFT